MKISGKVLIIGLLVVAGLAGFGWTRRNGVIEVETAAVNRQDLVVTVSASGKIRPAVEEIVFAPFAGTIGRVLVSDQQKVVQGQELLKFDLLPLLTARDQAQANLESAKLALENVERSSPLAEEKRAAQSLVDQTKNTFDDAQETYNDDQSDANRTSLDAARTAYDQAVAALRVLERRDPTQQAINNAKAVVASAQQSLLQARVNLGKSTLKAPRAGRIFFNSSTTLLGSFELKKGAGVTVGQELFRIYDDQQGLIFEVEADESDISKINFEQTAQVKLDAYPGKVFQGEVFYVSAQSHKSEAGENVFTVKIKLADFPQNLRFGLSGDAEIIIERQTAKLVLPFEAVKFEGDKALVFVVEGGRLKETQVEIGDEVGDLYEVLGGLSEGDQVVVSDLGKLKSGQKVKLP